MSETAIDFHVQALNVSIDASMATVLGSQVDAFTCDVVAELPIFLSDAKSLFRFQSDAIDITNDVNTDIKYKVNYETGATDGDGIPEIVMAADWLDGSGCACVGTDTDDAVYLAGTSNAAKKGVAFEYLRYLAHNLFNTHLGVDLFNNEEEVRVELDKSARVALDAKLLEIAALGTEGWVDANEALIDEAEDIYHPSYVMLNKIILNQPSRLAGKLETLLANPEDADQTGADPADPQAPQFYMPFEVDDTIQFKLTVNAATDQHLLLDAESTNDPIAPRTYRMVFRVVADEVV